MNFKEAAEEIKNRVSCKDYLTKSKGGLYCCPFCESGTGKNGTGALKVYETNTFTCHACNKSGDVIDIYQAVNNTDFKTAVYWLAADIGITIDTESPQTSPTRQETEKSAQTTTEKDKTPTRGETGQNTADYTAYYELCAEVLPEYPAAVSYLNGRGISLETAQKYGIGFDPKADPASAPGGLGKPVNSHKAPRIIMPTSKTHYVARRIDAGDFPKINPKGGTPGIFNSAALYDNSNSVVFVVEGIFDALSILETGKPAIALNSASNAGALLKMLEDKPTNATLILCPDNDEDEQTREKVQKKFSELADGLKRLKTDCITENISAGYKDANEALTENKTAFVNAIEGAEQKTAPKPYNTAYYLDALMSREIELFKDEKKTGFSNLDKESGGLNAGLYVLAAISSLGKTTFALQMAEQLAENGNDVLFFSLEQSRLELMSKILARRTVTKTSAGKLCFDDAKTSLQIRRGEWGENGSAVIKAAKEHREQVGDRLSIIEGNFSADISFLKGTIKRHIERNHTRPIVFIDYLQIIEAAEDMRNRAPGTKETIDRNIKDLKILSRNEDITIIVISSVNRANYQTPIDFESIKESGNVEYSCDVLWGLQLECLNDELFDKEGKAKEKRDKIRKAKAENPRKIELSCLKNRYGKSSYKCLFRYYPSCDLFIDAGTVTETESTQKKASRTL